MPLALLVLVLTAAWRILAIHVPLLGNFSPVMALAFCGGVYATNRWMRLAPFAALLISDLYLDHYYLTEMHYQFGLGGALARIGCFAAGLGLGYAVSRHRTWLTILGGALAASLLFYLATNSIEWVGDSGYSPTVAGWWQAMTVGKPGYLPTIYFFRNTLMSDMLFTACIAWVMESLARRRGAPSLLAPEKA